MVFTINGFSIVPYIGENGIKWSWNGVDSPEAGRTLDSIMHRGLIAIKARCDIECLWMPKDRAVALHKVIMPEFVTVVTDTVPWVQGPTTMKMYSNNGKANVITEYTDGTKLYGDVTFPLIQR